MDSNDKTNSIDDKHQLAWSQEIPNYGNKLLKRLDEFRKTTILYDVRVRAEGGEFNAHKVILAACGGIFRTYFVDEKKQMISSEITELSLDCPAQGLKPIIRFAYTGALIVTKRNAVATMIAAEVTKMKEVQEICADISVKEYGWIIHFDGEKDAATIENLGKVLQMHVACFTASCSNGSHVADSVDDLPFAEEVDKEFPDHTTTYQRLAIKLKSAETLVKTTKLKPKQSAEQKPAEPTKNIPAINAEVVEPVKSKPPVPNARSVKSKSDEVDGVKVVADDDKRNPSASVHKEKTPKKPVTSPSPTVKDPDSVNPDRPRPPSGRSVNPKSDEVDDVKVAADNDKTTPFVPVPKEKTPNKSLTSPSSTVKASESANPKPPRPRSGCHKNSKSDEVGDVKFVAGDDKVNLPPPVLNEKTPKKPPAPPSLKVKAPESANLKPPRPSSGAHKNSKSDEVGDIKIVADDDKIHLPPPPPIPNEKTPKKPAPPSPAVKAPESANSKPLRPPSGAHKNSKSDEVGDVKIVAGADKVHLPPPPPIPNEKTPKKPTAPPSPAVKAPESANPKPPRPPSGGHKNSKSDEVGDIKFVAGDDKVNLPPPPLVPNEKTPKKPPAPPSLKVKAPESANPKPPRPLSGGHKNLKSDEVGDVKIVAGDDEVHLPPPNPNEKPSPAVKAPESANAKPPRPPSGGHKNSKSDEVGDVKIVAGDDKVHLPPPPPIPNEKTPKKPAAPPSPAVKAPESANSKPRRPPSAGHETSKSDEVGDVKFVAGDDKVNLPPPVPNEKTPKKPAALPSPKVKAESANPKPSRPPNVSHKKSKSDESEAIESKDANVTAICNDQAPKKRSPPPTPKSKPPEPASPKPSMPNGAPKKPAPNAEKDGFKNTPPNKENEPAAPASTEGILKKQALPPSPRVKPRNSLKSKKSVPAPPPPSTADKSPKAAAPPRPTKAPAKVPPPRPRPPAVKKNSNPSEQGRSPAKKEVADNYDDDLNPFA